MVSGRPLLYWSLPSVAFLLGVFWFRRRNKNRSIKDKNGETTSGDEKHLNIKSDKENSSRIRNGNANGMLPNDSKKPNATKSMNIKNGIDSAIDEDDNPVTKLFGKSAPIKIQNGSRGSPVRIIRPQPIDSEVLKMKIQDAEQKMLRSIEEDRENLSSSVDLPDSIDNRSSFYSRNVNCNQDKPVIIKATTTPKISPENSFFESKYQSATDEQNNNSETKIEKTKLSQTQNEAINRCRIEEKDEPEENGTKSRNSNSSSSAVSSEGSDISCKQNTDSNSMENTKTVTADGHGSEALMDLNGNAKRTTDTASPSLSLCSMQSGDSGKGSSLPRSEANRNRMTYEFLFPNSLIGQLYGRKYAFIKKISKKTNANVSIKSFGNRSSRLHICVVEGLETEVNGALQMIRERLPLKRFPHFTMERIHYALPQTIVPLPTESLLNLELNLVEGINNDVVVSAVISGGHIFVQHPLHPSHPSLAVLQQCLLETYETLDAPLLPSIELSAVCVVPVNNMWYRVQIIQRDPEDEQRCVVKFLDFGGYLNVHFNQLRQIRSDFMITPFQATECMLSNIKPYEKLWSPESAEVLSKLTGGIVLQAQIAGYNKDNIPEIYLFACLGPEKIIFINKELVARNLAQWVEEVRD